jgi:hypothetical protein
MMRRKRGVYMDKPRMIDKRTAELIDLAWSTLNKAMLACWEYAETECLPTSGDEKS